jgi:hypothetical protein
VSDRAFILIRQLQGALGGRHLVDGLVDGATGDVLTGAGFTAVRDALGTYTLTWDTPFTRVPTVNITVADLSSVARAYYEADEIGATVHIKEPGVLFYDDDFTVHAWGV